MSEDKEFSYPEWDETGLKRDVVFSFKGIQEEIRKLKGALQNPRSADEELRNWANEFPSRVQWVVNQVTNAAIFGANGGDPSMYMAVAFFVDSLIDHIPTPNGQQKISHVVRERIRSGQMFAMGRSAGAMLLTGKTRTYEPLAWVDLAFNSDGKRAAGLDVLKSNERSFSMRPHSPLKNWAAGVAKMDQLDGDSENLNFCNVKNNEIFQVTVRTAPINSERVSVSKLAESGAVEACRQTETDSELMEALNKWSVFVKEKLWNISPKLSKSKFESEFEDRVMIPRLIYEGGTFLTNLKPSSKVTIVETAMLGISFQLGN